MWIVKLALQRPYTFVVLSILIFLGGLGSAITAPKDIFSVHQYSCGHHRLVV